MVLNFAKEKCVHVVEDIFVCLTILVPSVAALISMHRRLCPFLNNMRLVTRWSASNLDDANV